jgi:uncharacterized protein YndB with AHSA1/START domain
MTRRIENSIEVPGTPEEVWEAIATSHGIECWFVPANVENGRIAFDMGDGMEDAGTVTASEPPHRFVYEESWEAVEGEPPGRIASEFLVEAKAGGTCVVRLVSTLDAEGEGWDDALDSMFKGWETFLLNLRAYLTHFPGQRCATVMASGTGDWPSFVEALGLAGAGVGDRVRTAHAPTLAGTVEYSGESELLLRLEEPAPGLGLVYAYDWQGTTKTVVHLYLFGDTGAVAERETPAWRDWMAVPSAG